MHREIALAIILIGVAWVIPLVLLIIGVLRSRDRRPSVGVGWDWRLMLVSTLLSAIAFNLTFLVQEIFLVLPKALVPGLHPVLYHNDHDWTGSARIAELFEGTGAVAILVSGISFAIAGSLMRKHSWPALFIAWLAFEGVFEALPQFVLGAILPGNDVGRAYAYLRLDGVTQSVLALAALAAIPFAGIWTGRLFLSFADHRKGTVGRRSRIFALARVAALPAVAAVPLIIPFRVPRDPIEVVVLPLLVQVMGAGWVLVAAWLHGPGKVRGVPASRPTWQLFVLALLLLAIFQLVLRPGIRFY